MQTKPDMVPTPGSEDALDLGCTCAGPENNHGTSEPWKGGWLITYACPVHDMDTPPAA